MAFEQFPDRQYVTLFETDTQIRMGSMKLVDSIELQYIRVLLYINGNLAGNEKLQLKIYTDSEYTKKVYESSIVNVSDIGVTGDWIGYLRFDFDKINLNKNLTYYLACDPSDYSYTGSEYMSLSHDYPYMRYATSATSSKQTNLLFEVFGYV